MGKFAKKGFTLLEILIVTVMSSIIFLLVINLYTKMVETRFEVEARQSLMKNSYYIFERINVLIKDYTIDYEEYFNRRIVGCDNDAWENFSWDVGDNAHCDRFTSYGNKSRDNNSDHKIYYCSSESQENDNPNYVNKSSDLDVWSGCWNKSSNDSSFSLYTQTFQSFWEYEQQFRDRKGDTDGLSWVVFDDDEDDIWNWPVAIADNKEVQEIYLISKDQRERVFLRRNLIGSWDWDRDWVVNSKIDKLYSLQMLKFRGFDAWSDHDFDGDADWLYDGNIDTWTCDAGKWFECDGNSVWWSYNDYKLPSESNDGWVDVFWNEVTLSDRNIKVYPVKKPWYAWAVDSEQINPYVQIHIKTNLYWEPWSRKLNPEKLKDYQLDLQTTFNLRTNY